MIRLQIYFDKDNTVINRFRIETKIQCTDSSMAQSVIVQTMPEISRKPIKVRTNTRQKRYIPLFEVSDWCRLGWSMGVEYFLHGGSGITRYLLLVG